MNGAHTAVTRTAWEGALAELGIDPASTRARGVLAEILTRHEQPHRRWHRTSHLAGILQQLGRWRNKIEPELVLATLFHDLVYEPGSAHNEALSADLARDWLTGLGVPEPVVNTVVHLILLTRTHGCPGSFQDALFLDADMAVLGAHRDTYAAYQHAIRQEYHHISEGHYRLGRIRFLAGMLARRRLFHSPPGRALERAARSNMARELWQLLLSRPERAQPAPQVIELVLHTGTRAQLVEPGNRWAPGYQVLSCTPVSGEPSAAELEELASLAVRYARLKAKEVLGSPDSYLLIQSGPTVRRRGHYHCHLVPLGSVAGKARVYLYLGVKNCVHAIRRLYQKPLAKQPAS